MDLLFTSDDATVSDSHHLIRFLNDISDAAAQVGRDLRVASRLADFLSEHNFENVQSEALKLPMGPWPRDKRLKTVGLCHREQFLQGLSGIAMGLFTRLLHWSPEQVESYLALVRKDIINRRHHGYWKRFGFPTCFWVGSVITLIFAQLFCHCDCL